MDTKFTNIYLQIYIGILLERQWCWITVLHMQVLVNVMLVNVADFIRYNPELAKK